MHERFKHDMNWKTHGMFSRDQGVGVSQLLRFDTKPLALFSDSGIASHLLHLQIFSCVLMMFRSQHFSTSFLV